tara:strand:- start:8140 stop:8781 length:642 start_codon:yes stop_codon:yes gene_type:complete
MRLKVLVACEKSGTVAKAFRDKGNISFSNDLKPIDNNEENQWHIQGNCTEVIPTREWDLIIMHPECTRLAVSGNAWYGTGKDRHHMRIEAAKWTKDLWELAKENSKHVAMENPVGVLNRLNPDLPRPSYIQPYQFGHPEQKKTGLWLWNLPPLTPTNNVHEQMMELPINQRQRLHYLPPSKERAEIRSKTFQGIADAMANQWSTYITGEQNNG